MKRILSFCAVVAMLFASASCQQEIIPDGVNGDAVVSLSVAVPDAVTKAVGDGTNVDYLYYEIWSDNDGALNKELLASGIERTAAKTFDLELTLVSDQTYHFLFWAQKGQNNSSYDVTDLTKVKVNYDNAAGNDEDRAAFFAYKTIKVEGAVKETIYLKRPFAQLNFGTSTLKSSFMDEDVAVNSSTITVKKPATVFDLVNGVGGTPAANDVVFTAEEEFKLDPTTLSVSDKVYNYLSMNYFLVDGETNTVDVDAEFVTDFGTVSHEFTFVPVAENYRTNIIGDLLFNKADFEIIVDETFNTPDNIVVSDDWAHISGYNYVVNGDAGELALKEILEHADAAADAATKAEGPVVTIDLEGDVYWKTEGSHGSSPLLPATSKISKVVINGNGNTFTATGAGVGAIALANGGTLEFNDVNIVDKSVTYNEAAWELTYLEFAGKLAFKECTFNSGVQFQDETYGEGDEKSVVALNASFVDCRFITNEESVYAVWISDGTTTFNGCSFEGTRGLKMHEAYGSDVKSVTIGGCWFGPLSKKPGIAIGTLNADTEVTITNSKFSGCQVGDQGQTTYETDTDTSAFKFVYENNEAFDDQNTMLADALTDAQAGDVVEVPAGEYTFPAGSFKEGVTLKCAEGTVFEGSSSLNIKGAVVEGATFSNPGGNTVGGTINGTFKDCVFDGYNGLRNCYAGETTVFENCIFTGDVYGVHFDGGTDKEIIFKDCIFSGFNAFAAAIKLVTFEGCTFKSNGRSGYNGANLCGSTKMVNTEFTFDGSASSEWLDCIGSDKSYEFEDCTINGGSALNPDYIQSRNPGTKIVFDGVEYTYAEGDYYLSSTEAIVTNQESLKSAIAAAASNIILMPGNYVMPEPDLRGKELTIAGSKDVVIDVSAVDARDQFVTGATLKFEGVTLNFGKVNYMGFANTASLTYKDCDINGLQFLFGENVVFEGCSLNSNGAEHTVWTYGAKNVSFTGCDVTYGDRGVNCYSDNDVPGGKQTVNFTNCTFATENTASEGAVEINSCYFSVGIEVNIEGCTAPAYGQMAYVSRWDSTNGAKTTINIK